MKHVCLKAWRLMCRGLNNIPIMASYLFLVFSVIICLMILNSSCCGRVPVLSYCISEHELPVVYELHGNIKVINEVGEMINNNVEVFVGGYHASLTSTEVNLKFSAPTHNELYVVTRYEVNGELRVYTEGLVINERKRVINKEFIIYV